MPVGYEPGQCPRVQFDKNTRSLWARGSVAQITLHLYRTAKHRRETYGSGISCHSNNLGNFQSQIPPQVPVASGIEKPLATPRAARHRLQSPSCPEDEHRTTAPPPLPRVSPCTVRSVCRSTHRFNLTISQPYIAPQE